MQKYNREEHPFHLVNPSPWPFVVSSSVFSIVLPAPEYPLNSSQLPHDFLDWILYSPELSLGLLFFSCSILFVTIPWIFSFSTEEAQGMIDWIKELIDKVREENERLRKARAENPSLIDEIKAIIKRLVEAIKKLWEELTKNPGDAAKLALLMILVLLADLLLKYWYVYYNKYWNPSELELLKLVCEVLLELLQDVYTWLKNMFGV
jgi:predicted PurR-regulated permease PerM